MDALAEEGLRFSSFYNTAKCHSSRVSLLTGITFPNFFRLHARPPSRQDRAFGTTVILVWLTGGLSHINTYDMKPDTPSEYYGDFRPIRTNVPGIEVSAGRVAQFTVQSSW